MALRKPLKLGCVVLSFADTLYSADAAAVEVWSRKVLMSNMSYYRLRRELFEEFCRLLSPAEGVITCNIGDEDFLVIRYFLTARNDALDDNKRLSFDKAIVHVRQSANSVLRAPPAPAGGGVAGFLGFGAR